MREVKLGRRARPTEQEALPVRAARCAHEHKLGFGLDTLGDHVDAEAPPQPSHRGNDCCAFGIPRQFADERAVNLYLVESQFAQVAQARISSAEIIHDDADPSTLECLQYLAGDCKIADQCSLSDLGFKPVRRKFRLLQNGQDCVAKGWITDLTRRKIEGERDMLRPG